MGRLVETLRERVRPRDVVAVTGLWYLSTVVYDAPTIQFVVTLAGSAVAGGADLLADAYDLRGGVRTAGLGLTTLFGAGALLELGASTVLPVFLALAGLWLVTDGVQSIRHAGLDAPPEEPPDGRDVYRQYLSRRIRRLLRDQPRSRSELREAIDADDETVDSVLGDLREQDLVTRRAGVYRATAPSEPGTLARIGDLLGRAARRLARPVAVEFSANAGYAEDEDTPSDTGRAPVDRDEHDDRAVGDRDPREDEPERSRRDETERA